MSSVFGVSVADIERRLPEFIPQGRTLICYFSSIVILLFIFMNSRFFLLDSPFWLFLGVLLIAVMIKCASFQQNLHRPQAQAPTGPGNELHTEEQVNVPTFVTREQLPDIRIQLAQLNREFDDSDYDALRALDEDIAQHVFAMSEEDINALPIYKYQVQSQLHTQFHASCIFPWLQQRGTCPICKRRAASV